MAALTRTSKAHLTAQRVSRDLEEAIANYELFSPSGTNRDITASMREKLTADLM
jgi:hypothetical protein